jgi:hypothetical protein
MKPSGSRGGGEARADGTGRLRRPSCFAVMVLTALAVFAAALARLQGGASEGAAWFRNVIFPHTLTTLVLRRYTPGLATAWLAVLPTSAPLLWKAVHEGAIDSRRLWIVGSIVVAGILVSIPAVFWAGRRGEESTPMAFAAVRYCRAFTSVAMSSWPASPRLTRTKARSAWLSTHPQLTLLGESRYESSQR